MNKWKRIYFSRPTKLLDQFTENVDNGNLDRLAYKVWRELKKYFDCIEKDKKHLCVETDTMDNIYFSDSNGWSPHRIEDIFGTDSSFGTMISHFLEGSWGPWSDTKPIFEDFSGSMTDPYGALATINLITPPDCTTKTIDIGSTGLASNGYYDNLCATSASQISNKLDKLSATWAEVIASAAENKVVIDGDLVVKGKIINENIDKERESNDMKFNFDFGTCENDNVRVSPYGIAIKNATGTWVSYDAKTGNIIDVDIFNFNGGKYLFKMPVAIKDVKVGDIVIHNRVACFVKGITDGTVIAIDPYAGEEKAILFTKTPFGFDFITKVVCLFDNLFSGASNDNPFGNMLPFFLMSNSDNKNSKDNIDPLMMAMLLGGGNCGGALQNPMMLALMCADQTNMRDVLPLMMLAGQNGTSAAN